MNTKILLIPALFAALAMSAQSHAAGLTQLKKPTNAALQAVIKSGDSFSQNEASGAFRVTLASDASGRSREEQRLNALKQAIHAHFGADFSDGIKLDLEPSSEKGVQQALSDLSIDSNSNGEAGDEAASKALEAALRRAVADSGIELYSGSGSGNNTEATLIGLYDTKNDELIFVGFSNFGSED